MSNRLAVLLSSVLVSGLLATACGAKSNDGGSAAQAKPATSATSASAAGKVTRATESDPADAALGFDCQQYIGQGTDFMSSPAAYMFIGPHPMCAEPEKVKEFCGWLATRDGFMNTRAANDVGENAVENTKSMDEDARAAYLAHYPKHVLEQALQKCGMNLDQQHSKLVAAAEAAINGGAKDDTAGGDVSFFVNEAPDRAERLWKRECEGHYVQKTVGEGYETHFAGGKSSYASFCMGSVNADTIPPKFKAPGKVKN